jgi:hypothetical protein
MTVCQKDGDLLESVVRELRGIIARARGNATLKERRRIVAALRKAAGKLNLDASTALNEAARAIEDETP